MLCPRDGATLAEEHMHGIEVDHCFTCHGRCLDHEQLDQLEATRASEEDHRRGMTEYAQRDSDLACPICGEQMTAFNYRGYNLELDTCSQEHGFWLDAGDEGRVRDIIDKRVKGLQRAKSAEAAWGDFLDGLRGAEVAPRAAAAPGTPFGRSSAGGAERERPRRDLLRGYPRTSLSRVRATMAVAVDAKVMLARRSAV